MVIEKSIVIFQNHYLLKFLLHSRHFISLVLFFFNVQSIYFHLYFYLFCYFILPADVCLRVVLTLVLE